MRRLALLFNRIIRLWGSPHSSRPEDIPQRMPPEALEKALHEARFLHEQAVDVRPLAHDELPGLPRRADR